MNKGLVILFTVIGIATLGLTIGEANAELRANNAFILEGSGFAITDESIKTTEIDFAMTARNKAGSTINILVEDGFITLNEDDFLVVDLAASGLREGRYIRISGTAEDPLGSEVSLRFFGRLIENSAEGSVYGFTGRLTHDGIDHKIIYTTKLSELTSVLPTLESEDESSELTIHISLGASNKGLGTSYIDALGSGFSGKYFSPDRVSTNPGVTITFVNDDVVSHRVVSGSGLGTHSTRGEIIICETPQEDLPEGVTFRNTECSFTFDGRIDSGEIKPGKSWTSVFSDKGFYRIIDPDYPWMNIVIYSFPDTGSQVIRQVGPNETGN